MSQQSINTKINYISIFFTYKQTSSECCYCVKIELLV